MDRVGVQVCASGNASCAGAPCGHRSCCLGRGLWSWGLSFWSWGLETIRGEAAVATAAGAACADATLAFATHSFLRPEEEARAGGSAADPDALEAVVSWAMLATL